MEEANKLPLKRVELPLSKFNEVAIPHHLDLLRQHKTNIIKYEEAGEYARVRAEQTNARRVAAQLRALLGELEALRRQVRSSDLPRFDALTKRSRDLTLKAIVDYLETSPLSINRRVEEPPLAGSAVSTDSVGVVAHATDAQQLQPLLQLQVDEHEAVLREREAVLRGWSSLQREVRALHEAWQHVQAAASAQREQVSHTATQVETAAENVQAARSDLALAERIRAGAYGAGGAALGALAMGPAGLVIGAKAGAAAALAGSLLGYVAARVLGTRRQQQIDAAGETADKDKDE
ncbi:hypothetical protein ABMA28_010762 [Loxostege sticticalis]|uniref:STX17-like N-terminal domain-containing protein n=1 Tax=Loxostege sticticalis TaxID=481309 RepID=A0ABD0S9B5_LOXSC